MVINNASQHPIPAFLTGPAIEEPFPDFTPARGNRRAVLVVHRSAAW